MQRRDGEAGIRIEVGNKVRMPVCFFFSSVNFTIFIFEEYAVCIKQPKKLLKIPERANRIYLQYSIPVIPKTPVWIVSF